MARVTYEQGIKCRKCGKFQVSIDRFQSYVLCPWCGTHLGNFDRKKRVMSVTNNADIITLKVTHKFFSEIYEEVK